MQEVYLLQRNDGLFLNKQQDWVDGDNASELYRATHRDDAINTKVELTIKAPDLRLEVITCTLTEKGVPRLPEHCDQR